MVNNLFLVCSIVVFHPEGNEYIELKKCKAYRLDQIGKLLVKYGVDPYGDDIALSTLHAEQERAYHEMRKAGEDDELQQSNL